MNIIKWFNEHIRSIDEERTRNLNDIKRPATFMTGYGTAQHRTIQCHQSTIQIALKYKWTLLTSIESPFLSDQLYEDEEDIDVGYHV